VTRPRRRDYTGAMRTRETRRRLFWHGVFLFLLGLLAGVAVPAFANPRMGLAAHLAGVMSGTFLAVLGALWGELRLSPRMTAVAFWLVLYGMYVGWAAVLLAAVFDTSMLTPMAGAGHTAAAWQEAVVNAALLTSAPAAIAACLPILWGLRGRVWPNDP